MSTQAQESPPDWVPVEHRLFGLDRRTFRPALIVLTVALVLIYGLPLVSAAIPWHNAIKAGDVLDLGGGATAVPPVGWQLESGALVGAAGGGSPVQLATGGATIAIQVASFPGSADAFLDQVQRAEGDDRPGGLGGGRTTATTDSGLVGVAQSSTSTGGDGLEVAFKLATGSGPAVAEAPALLVVVRTAPGQFERFQQAVTALVRSITPAVNR
ncbi:hypothetical protein [Paractinoplanes rishiriensis]|uniref:Uncharacterized protein n=1 Tax=Paractinoplanes rishiriensis TaxID=1050105 RepID=A0A919N079_9ACTN|nr:hypothetical protein [Actinoplanes rishiriensis]GIE99275.1 hypothetical protein Ari01nite_67400 [Actinoplanes rishiriensis]